VPSAVHSFHEEQNHHQPRPGRQHPARTRN
jgi:hypothetical protein